MEITEYTKRAAGEGAEGEARAPKGCPSSRECTEDRVCENHEIH